MYEVKRLPEMQHAVSLVVGPQQVSEKAIAAIEWMLTLAKVTAEPGGGLTWAIELDGYSFSMTVDRDGSVRATASD
jgi:hypothetical protein